MYVTLEEANTYIASHFLSTDPLRAIWETLLPENQEVLLTRSYESIEALPLRGRKASYDQTAAFPRWPDTTVPVSVCSALIENAIALCDAEDIETYRKMWKYGITEYKVGNLSEKVDKTAGTAGIELFSGIVSQRAMQLLNPFLTGPFCIRR